MRPPTDFDEAADLYASYYAAVAELRRRLEAGEYLPPEWRPASYRGPEEVDESAWERI